MILPPQCKLFQGDQEFSSFTRTRCNLEHCTTSYGACNDLDRLCCCRAISIEELDIRCEDGLVPNADLTTNASHCGCTICDDILVKVMIFVHEPGEERTPIVAAQVIDSDTDETLGLTYTNGMVEFTVPLSQKTVSVIVLAANYLPRERVVKLFPTSQAVYERIALAKRNIITVQPGDSGYTFSLGSAVFITIPAGGFKKNGTLYNDVVVFDGVYMDAGEEGVLDMVEGNQFFVDGAAFALTFMTFLHFSDAEGNHLEAEYMNYYVQVRNLDSNQDIFLVTFDSAADEYRRLGTLEYSSSLQKRQQGETSVLNTFNVPLQPFIIQASANNISCWLQARSFQEDRVSPILGLVITLEQTGVRNGQPYLFVFGTNTGNAQSRDDQLDDNAICLPLACDSFTLATVEGNFGISSSERIAVTPIDFPPNTFNASEIGAPTTLGPYFTFQEVVTASEAGAPRPFYSNLESCVEYARMPLDEAALTPASYFAFSEELSLPVPEGNCFMKVLVTECFENAANRIVILSINPDDGLVISNFILVEDDDSFMIPEASGDGGDNDTGCFEVERIACVPFECNYIVQVQVLDDVGFQFCSIDTLAPVLQSSLITGNTQSEQLLVESNLLVEQDYNSLNTGLYFNPVDMIARDLCLMADANNVPSSDGFAVRFNCVLE